MITLGAPVDKIPGEPGRVVEKDKRKKRRKDNKKMTSANNNNRILQVTDAKNRRTTATAFSVNVEDDENSQKKTQQVIITTHPSFLKENKRKTKAMQISPTNSLNSLSTSVDVEAARRLYSPAATGNHFLKRKLEEHPSCLDYPTSFCKKRRKIKTTDRPTLLYDLGTNKHKDKPAENGGHDQLVTFLLERLKNIDDDVDDLPRVQCELMSTLLEIMKPCVKNDIFANMLNISPSKLFELYNKMESITESSLQQISKRKSNHQKGKDEPFISYAAKVTVQKHTPAETTTTEKEPGTGKLITSSSRSHRKIKKVLRKTFGSNHDISLQQLQFDAITSALNGRDTFVMGSSNNPPETSPLCYQVMALLMPGVTIVVSPLVDAMRQHVLMLSSHGIKCARLGWDVLKEEKEEINDNLLNGKLKILYLTPEMLFMPTSDWLQLALNQLYQENRLSHFVVDNADYIINCGADFRPSYEKLGLFFKKKFPAVPVMAVTPFRLRKSSQDLVMKRLGLDIMGTNAVKMFEWPPYSQNNSARVQVRYKGRRGGGGGGDKKNDDSFGDVDIIKYIKQDDRGNFGNSSGIIFCITQEDTVKMTHRLRLSNILATCYHAGLSLEAKSQNYEDWAQNKVKIMCCTTAIFGHHLLDKPNNISFIIHHSLPSSLDVYYKQLELVAGPNAECILYLSYTDVARHYFIQKEAIKIKTEQKELVSHLNDKITCRRVQWRLFYDDDEDENATNYPARECYCDNCSSPALYITMDVSEISGQIVQLIKDNNCSPVNKSITFVQLTNKLKGSSKRPGILQLWSVEDIERLIMHLICEGTITAHIDKFPIGRAYFRLSVSRNPTTNEQNEIVFFQVYDTQSRTMTSSEKIERAKEMKDVKQQRAKNRAGSELGKVMPFDEDNKLKNTFLEARKFSRKRIRKILLRATSHNLQGQDGLLDEIVSKIQKILQAQSKEYSDADKEHGKIVMKQEWFSCT